MANTINMYCLKCKEWVDDWAMHDCPSGYWIVVDEEMVGIAERLHSMGITPLTAIWVATEMGAWDDYRYQISIKIDVGGRISEAILGELPSGWHYFWETAPPIKVSMHMIAFVEQWYNLGFETKEERINEVIRGFEEFLDTRDPEAVKAIMLLTSC